MAAITGTIGSDTFYGSLNGDSYDGAGGSDQLNFAQTGTNLDVNFVEGWVRDMDDQSRFNTFANLQSFFGGWGDDRVLGNQYDNTIRGEGGDDIIEGGLGMDFLNGGAGEDTASYASASAGVTVSLAITTMQNTGVTGMDSLTGFENLKGSAFADTLTGDAGDNLIEGGAGDDKLYGGLGFDGVSYANASAAVQVNLNAGTAAGGDGADTLSGFEGAIGSRFADSIIGTAGNNKIMGGEGDDYLDAGTGVDVAVYRHAKGAVTVSLATGLSSGADGADTLLGFENIAGGQYGDTLTGNALANLIDGAGGDDVIDGGEGIDTAGYQSAGGGVSVDLTVAGAQDTGSAGLDTLRNIENLLGSDYNDDLSGNLGANLLEGGAGADSLYGDAGDDMLDGGAGSDSLDGGANFDTVVYAKSLSAVAVDLALGTGKAADGVDSLLNIEGVRGSVFDDVLRGNSVNNVFEGAGGNDFIDGGSGSDTVVFSAARAGVRVNLEEGWSESLIPADRAAVGVDELVSIENVKATAAADVIVGSDAANLLEGLAGNDKIDGGWGGDVIRGGDGNDKLIGGSDNGFDVMTDTLYGDAGDDWLSGGAGADLLFGGVGNDILIGGAGADKLSGDAGNDRIDGGDGNDLIDGGEGMDLLRGGSGADIFRFASPAHIGLQAVAGGETVMDFVSGSDRIDLSVIDAKTGGLANDAFVFVTKETLTANNANGAVWFDAGVLFGSTDGDLDAEFSIALMGVTTLKAADIIL